MGGDGQNNRPPDDHKLARAEKAHDIATEFGTAANKAAIDAGVHTLKAFLLINGGSAVAILAFFGRLFSQERIESGVSIEPLISSLLWFAWGVAAAAAGMGLAYLTNYAIASNSFNRKHIWDHPYTAATFWSRVWHCASFVFQLMAVSVGVASLLFF